MWAGKCCYIGYEGLLKEDKEKNVELTMYGVNYAGDDKIYDGKVHLVDLGYRVDKKMNYEEARKLFYSIVDGFLEAINRNESIRDCFSHFPITYQDLYFRLSFDYENKGYLNRDDISMIAILENEIMYFIVDEDGGNIGIETRQVAPDVYIGTGVSPKTRCVTKKLPEEAKNN